MFKRIQGGTFLMTKSKTKKPKKKSLKVKAVSAILYLDSLNQPQLDAETGTTFRERIMGQGSKGLRNVTGFMSPLHDHDAQRNSYTISEDDSEKYDVTTGIYDEDGKYRSYIFAGNLTMFIHLAGGALTGGDEVKSLPLVQKTSKFLAESMGYNKNPDLVKNDPAYFVEDFTDDVLKTATKSDLTTLPRDFFLAEGQAFGDDEKDKNDLKKVRVPDLQMLKAHLYKKPHYHLTLITLRDKPKGVQSFLAQLQGSLGKTAVTLSTVQPVRSSIEQVFLYASHHSATAIAEHKHEYDPMKIMLLPGFNLDDYRFSSKEVKLKTLHLTKKIVQIVYDLKISNLASTKYFRYICTSSDLAYYWSDAQILKSAISDAWLPVIDEALLTLDIEMGKYTSKIGFAKTDFKYDNSTPIGELERKSNENKLRMAHADLRLQRARLMKDKLNCAEMMHLIDEGMWPSEQILFDSLVSYRASYKDLFESQRRLKENR